MLLNKTVLTATLLVEMSLLFFYGTVESWAEANAGIPVVRESQSIKLYSTQSPPTSNLLSSEKGSNSDNVSNDSISWELMQEIELLKKEISRLNGRLEKQSNQIKSLTQRYQVGYEDLDQRLSSMALHSQSADDTVDEKQTLSAEPQDDVENNPIQLSGYELEKYEYEKAQGLLKDKKVEQAVVAFNEFLQKYPMSALAPNAAYWQGELYLAQQPPSYDKAYDIFERFLTQYKEHRKVANVMYKLALIDSKKNNISAAEKRLEQLLEAYPNSSPAKLAKAQLEYLKQQ